MIDLAVTAAAFDKRRHFEALAYISAANISRNNRYSVMLPLA